MEKKILILISIIILAASLGAACSGPQETNTAAATSAAQQVLTLPTETASPTLDTDPAPGSSGLPEEVETYYKTMVFIQGTAQLMAQFDLDAITSSEDQSLILMLIAMPGVMDDHLIAASKLSIPDGLESAWEKASSAEANLIQSLEEVLMTYDSASFSQAVISNQALASEAVAEAEAVLADEYGASSDGIAAANRAALTEMGEAYQTFVSMIAVGQSQADEDTQ